jgi:predicted nucleotidyltransferase
MHQTLASTLLPEYRRRILAVLLLHPEEALHGREVARRTGLPAGTVARELVGLTNVGLLKRHRQGNQQIYQAQTDCPVFGEVASILRKTSGLANVLTQLLSPVGQHIRAAFIFGSVAQGQERVGSDIDVLIVGDIAFDQTVEVLYPAQSALGREINPKVFRDAEFAERAATDAFVRDVLAKPKIFLIGSERELEQLVGRQP